MSITNKPHKDSQKHNNHTINKTALRQEKDT